MMNPRSFRASAAGRAVLPVVLLALGLAPAAGATPPPATPPFTDYRDAAPGARHRITVADLPAPYATRSSGNSPHLVPRPAGVLPRAPEGFAVTPFATGLDRPRVLRVAPNGDVFLAETGAGRIRVYRGRGADGGPQRSAVFAQDLVSPYGIAFYPPGPDPQWVYVGATNEVVRFAYSSGAMQAAGPAQHIADLPGGGGHWTRDLRFSADGRTLFVAVGSASNVDDPDTSADEQGRARILAMDPDGANRRDFATGLRNPSGLAIDPQDGQLWTVVNERDGLGDDLVPDYVAAVHANGFYGWPWWYLGPHQDPRHQGKHPQDRARARIPEVLLQPHSAPLQLEFYEGTRFPPQYRGDIFLTAHGSWNRSVRTGYEVMRVPKPVAGTTGAGYEDFLTGFVLADGSVWGRPVGLTVAADGALLVSDDVSGSIWRVDYRGN